MRGGLILGLVFLLVLGGCSEPDRLMPLGNGHEVTYLVKTGLAARVEPVRVVRNLPVAGVEGAELSGPLGTSRLAWKDGVLVADSLVNGRFSPPLPLLATDRKARTWHGRVETLGREQPGSAKLVHDQETLSLGARKVFTTKATLTLDLPQAGGKIEVISWYQSAVGLVQQEQRTNGQLVLQLQLLSGP